MRHKERRDRLGLPEIILIAGLAVHHRKAVKAPALPAGPGGIVRESLHCNLAPGLEGGGVVVQQMPGTAVRAEMVGHGGVGMGVRDPGEARPARKSRYRCEQLEVHHIVDDHHELRLPRVVPGAKAADFGIETGAQRAGGILQHRAILFAAREAVGVAETAAYHEAHVVGGGVELLAAEALGHVFGCGAERLLAGIFIQIPEFAGEEAAGPVAGTGEYQLPVLPHAEGDVPPGRRRRREGVIHQFRLLLRPCKALFDYARHLRRRAARHKQRRGSDYGKLSHDYCSRWMLLKYAVSVRFSSCEQM